MARTEQSHPLELLSELCHAYRHTREEHDREARGGSTRRRLRQTMEQLRQRFERLLELWVPEEGLAEAWRGHFFHGTEAPRQPTIDGAPLFVGRTAVGAVVEIRRASDGGYDIVVDGKVADHEEIPWHLSPEMVEPIHIGAWECHEVVRAPREAVAALEVFVRGAGPVPTAYGRALYEDGLIDADFGLTPRGLRVLKKKEATPSVHEANVCVLLVDAARARVMLLREREVAGSKLTELYEVADVANPRWRATDAERFADNRPGLRRESPGGPQHALGDRRDWWRRDMMRSFAQQVVEEAANIWNELPSGRVVVVADAQMLGVLRPIIARQNTGPSRREVVEVQRQLTQLSVPAVHDALAKADVLPPRGRLPPPRPMRTPNPWHGA